MSTVEGKVTIEDSLTLHVPDGFLTRDGLKTRTLNKPPMKLRQAKAHMEAAYVYAGLSYCNRRQVGCVIVKDDRIISIGYNGTPPGHDNCCEDDQGATKPEVIHAEHNAIKKLEQSPETGDGATLFVTTAPCLPCAEMIRKSGIRHVCYDEMYRTDEGIRYLRERGIVVEHLPV